MSQIENKTMGWPDVLKLLVACAAVIACGSFVYYMLGQTKTEEKEWTRAVYLFQGVEAVAFAAAGFIFGKEVHRERAEKAEKRANEKEDGAAKGKALAEIVKCKAQTHPARVTAQRALAASPEKEGSFTQVDFDELATVAKQLLVSGFLNEVVDRLDHPAINALVRDLIEQKFARH